jgi:hypothetical protein
MSDNPRAGGAGDGDGRQETFRSGYLTPSAPSGKALDSTPRIAAAAAARPGKPLAIHLIVKIGDPHSPRLRWRVAFLGIGWVEVTTRQLQLFWLFRAACARQLGSVPEPLTTKRWWRILGHAMAHRLVARTAEGERVAGDGAAQPPSIYHPT